MSKLIVHGGIALQGSVTPIPNKNSFLAALADKAETIINGAEILKRRYPDIEKVYRSLGARVELK